MNINIGDTGWYTSYPISPYTGLPVWYCKVLEIHDDQLDVEVIVTGGLIKKTINKTDFDKKLILWDGVKMTKTICDKCNDFGWVCENHSDQEAFECKHCKGAGMPCKCHQFDLLKADLEVKKAIELANELDKLWDKSFRNPMVSKSADMLRQQAKEIEVLNQSYEILFKHRIEQEKENKQLITEIEVLRANIRGVANQLRGGVSKIQQKTMARVIEECFGEKK